MDNRRGPVDKTADNSSFLQKDRTLAIVHVPKKNTPNVQRPSAMPGGDSYRGYAKRKQGPKK